MTPSSPYCPTCGAANPPQAAFCFACGQALNLASGLQTGLLPANQMLRQRYRILAQVGKGGFGAVYQAEDTQLGNRLVAIKEMSQYGLSPQELTQAIDAFQREAILLAGLKNPSLPLIYDQFSDAGRQYLVMEFIVGQTLEDYLTRRGGKLPLAETLQIGLQLCHVLEYLHTRQPPIIFRDLKPSNVMLTAEGQLYLIDFGIARHFKPGQQKDTIAFGSPGYAAPEQYGKAQTNPRSDLYSLGAMLHQMLSGNDPSDTPFRFAPLAASLPGGLATLIIQMVDLDESKRPASAGAVRQVLQRSADTLGISHQSAWPVVVQPMPPIQPAQATPAPYGLMPSTAAAVPNLAAPLAGPANAAPATYMPNPAAPPAAQRPPVIIDHSPKKQPIVIPHATYDRHTDWVWCVAWSPDGRYIASASQDTTVQVWDATTLDPIATYHRHDEEVFSVAWSPDGKRIASASADATVQVWHALTGKHLLTYSNHTNVVIDVAWSPDGTYIVSGSADRTVQVWDAFTGRPLLPYHSYSSKAKTEVYAVAWSPDGEYIAFGGEASKIQVWRPGATKPNDITYSGHNNTIEALSWSPDGARIASASIDGSVQVWDAVTGNQIFRYDKHTGIGYTVAWSPDGKQLASSGLDKTVQVWTPTKTGRPICAYREHRGEVRSVAWSPDGKRIASGGLDKTVHVWQPTW